MKKSIKKKIVKVVLLSLGAIILLVSIVGGAIYLARSVPRNEITAELLSQHILLANPTAMGVNLPGNVTIGYDEKQLDKALQKHTNMVTVHDIGASRLMEELDRTTFVHPKQELIDPTVDLQDIPTESNQASIRNQADWLEPRAFGDNTTEHAHATPNEAIAEAINTNNEQTHYTEQPIAFDMNLTTATLYGTGLAEVEETDTVTIAGGAEVSTFKYYDVLSHTPATFVNAFPTVDGVPVVNLRQSVLVAEFEDSGFEAILASNGADILGDFEMGSRIELPALTKEQILEELNSGENTMIIHSHRNEYLPWAEESTTNAEFTTKTITSGKYLVASSSKSYLVPGLLLEGIVETSQVTLFLPTIDYEAISEEFLVLTSTISNKTQAFLPPIKSLEHGPENADYLFTGQLPISGTMCYEFAHFLNPVCFKSKTTQAELLSEAEPVVQTKANLQSEINQNLTIDSETGKFRTKTSTATLKEAFYWSTYGEIKIEYRLSVEVWFAKRTLESSSGLASVAVHLQ